MFDINCFTIDLEPWMCIYDNPRLVKHLDNGLTEETTYKILDILDKYDIKATFFVLSKIYEWYPELIEEIAREGHEIAFHTHEHNIIHNAKILEREIHKANSFLKAFKPKGFRAPQMILPKSALPVLTKYGFKYSSSIYASFGKPIFLREKIIEVPVSTFPLLKINKCITYPRSFFYAIKKFEIPFGSGLCVSLLNSSLLNKFVKKCNERNKSAILFVHPWQLIVDKIKGPIRNIQKIPYIITKITVKKLYNLFENHYFTTISNLLKDFNL